MTARQSCKYSFPGSWIPHVGEHICNFISWYLGLGFRSSFAEGPPNYKGIWKLVYPTSNCDLICKL